MVRSCNSQIYPTLRSLVVAKDSNKENTEAVMGRGKRSVVLTDQTRNKSTNEDKRKEHQKMLAQQLNDAARQRLAQASGSSEAKKYVKPSFKSSALPYCNLDSLG